MVPLTILPENQAKELTTLKQKQYAGTRFHSYFYTKSHSNDKKLYLQDSVTPCKLHPEHVILTICGQNIQNLIL